MDEKNEVEKLLGHVEKTCHICGEKFYVKKEFADDKDRPVCLKCLYAKIFGESKDD